MEVKKRYKIVLYVPTEHGDRLRQVMGEAGAGRIGNYTNCSFTILGTGRFIPGDGANPTIGEVGKPEVVEEERIETICEATVLKEVILAIRAAHPYEEPALDVYPIEVIE